MLISASCAYVNSEHVEVQLDQIFNSQIFNKTDQGRAALDARSLIGKLRTILILVNGRNSVKVLHSLIGPEASELIGELQRLGHVQTSDSAPPESEPVPVDVRPEIPPEDAAAPALSDEPARLLALKREAIVLLSPYYGPAAEDVAKPLLQAASLKAFFDALRGIECRLAIFLGKANAARILARLRRN